MKKSYFMLNPGRLSRKDNTLKFTPVDAEGTEGQPKYLPIEGVSQLYVYGSLDANSALYNFLGKHEVAVHFFDYYGHYTGSFMPKEYLLAGKVVIEQVRHYLEPELRLPLARKFLEGSSRNMVRTVRYYANRGKEDALGPIVGEIETLCAELPKAEEVPALMGLEGNIWQWYYSAFDHIIEGFRMDGRSRQPPGNEVNALISFGNMCCYTACLDAIYHSQLNPTVSFLHEPGYRRYSLALDLAEVFKPILVDRLIFSLLNKKMLQADDFEHHEGGVLLKEKGRKEFLRRWDERLNETIKHRTLGRSVSYRHLIRLECYKLSKHILAIDEYAPFRAWW